jgi:hypothetical protein
MSQAVGPLLQRRAGEELVGRGEELGALLAALAPDGPLVSCLHGIAGVGKTTLLHAFVAGAQASGATVIRIDCRTVEPTQASFLQEVSRAIGADGADLPEIARRLGEVGDRVVLALDTYEVLRLLDGWLRQEFVPALGTNVRLVLAGREVPVFAWEGAPGWHGHFRSIPLGPLSETDATALLRRDGVGPEAAKKLNRAVRGHPLALVIAAGAIHERPDLEVEDAALQSVIGALARAYLDELDPRTRGALDAASVVRRLTASLFRAMVGDAAPDDAMQRLQRLPFVEVMCDGLVLHETMQQVIAGMLRATNPERYRALKQAAWRQLRREVAGVGRAELWRYTADMLFLIENPVPREAFFPSDPYHYVVEPARPDDGGAVLDIVERHTGPSDAAGWRLWWERRPEAFRIVRDADGAVAGFTLYFDPATVPGRWLDEDPICAVLAHHLRRQRMPGPGRSLIYRGQLDRDRGDAPGGVQAACWLDIKRAYMELRPHLRTVYAGVYDLETYGPIAAPLGFTVTEPARIDERTFFPTILEFGPGSVDAWLARIAASELGIADEELLDAENRQMVLDGERIDLTPLEFGVLRLLIDREGRAVRRHALLEDVWGYDHAAAGSNVLEVVVRSLRRKLGAHGRRIETVRGLGYRWRT